MRRIRRDEPNQGEQQEAKGQTLGVQILELSSMGRTTTVNTFLTSKLRKAEGHGGQRRGTCGRVKKTSGSENKMNSLVGFNI